MVMCLRIALILELIREEAAGLGLQRGINDRGEIYHIAKRGYSSMIDFGGRRGGRDNEVFATRGATVATIGEISFAEV